jgi:hypothetical protein
MDFNKKMYYEIDRQFNRFLEFFAYQCCSCKSPVLWGLDEAGRPYRAVGCCRTVHPQTQAPHHELQREGFYATGAHHSGYFQHLLADGPPIPAEGLRSWLDDTEHGLVHGFCTAFMLFWMKYPEGIPDKVFQHLHIKKEERLPKFNESVPQLLAALLHDFCRTLVPEELRGMSAHHEGHDEALKDWFPGLWPSAYNHTSAPADADDPLINADRMELRRFRDHDDWIRPRYLDQARAKLPKPLLRYFYKFMRPAISYLLQHRQQLWFRHGPERMAYGGGWESLAKQKWTPNTPYPALYLEQPTPGLYCVETGRPPFEDCFWHGRGFQPWGFIPKPVAMQYARAKPIHKRDHLGLDARIPLRHWMFMFARGQKKFAKRHDHWLDPQLLSSGVGHMEMLTTQKMFATVNRFMEMFCALRVEEDDALCR